MWNGDNNVTSNADCNEVLVDNRLDCKGGTVDTKWVNRLDRQVTGRKDNDGNDSGEGIRDQEDLCPRPLEQRTRSWTYKTNFTLPTTTIDSRSSNKYVLVFEGVKMGATVKINGVALGSKNMTDQFLRYEYVIPQSVLERGHASLRSVLRKSYSNRDDNVADYAQLDHNRAGSPCYYGLCWMHICTGESTLWRIARQAMQFLLRSCSALLSLICEAKLCGVLTAENASSEKVTLSHQKNLVHELSVTFDPAIGTNGRFMVR